MPHLVVHREAAHDERRAQKDETVIILGIGENGIRRSEEAEQGIHQEETCHGNQAARDERREETYGGHFFRLVRVAAPKRPGDEIPRALTEIESDGLNEGHVGEDDAEGGHGLRIDLPHEERVRQVVNAGDQHADDGRNGQRGHEMPYRSRSHPDELLFLKVGGHTLFLIAKVSKFDGPVVFRCLVSRLPRRCRTPCV